MKLISNWKKAWRMLSVQFMFIASALQGAWIALPSNLVSKVPEGLVHVITLGLLVLGIAGRLIVQPKLNPKDFEPTSQDGESRD